MNTKCQFSSQCAFISVRPALITVSVSGMRFRARVYLVKTTRHLFDWWRWVVQFLALERPHTRAVSTTNDFIRAASTTQIARHRLRCAPRSFHLPAPLFFCSLMTAKNGARMRDNSARGGLPPFLGTVSPAERRLSAISFTLAVT